MMNVGGWICGGILEWMLLFEVVMGGSIGGIELKFIVDDGLLLDLMDLDFLSE